MFKWIIPLSVLDDVFGPVRAKWAIVDRMGNCHYSGSRADCLEVKESYSLNLPEYRFYVIPSVSVR